MTKSLIVSPSGGIPGKTGKLEFNFANALNNGGIGVDGERIALNFRFPTINVGSQSMELEDNAGNVIRATSSALDNFGTPSVLLSTEAGAAGDGDLHNLVNPANQIHQIVDAAKYSTGVIRAKFSGVVSNSGVGTVRFTVTVNLVVFDVLLGMNITKVIQVHQWISGAGTRTISLPFSVTES